MLAHLKSVICRSALTNVYLIWPRLFFSMLWWSIPNDPPRPSLQMFPGGADGMMDRKMEVVKNQLMLRVNNFSGTELKVQIFLCTDVCGVPTFDFNSMLPLFKSFFFLCSKVGRTTQHCYLTFQELFIGEEFKQWFSSLSSGILWSQKGN